MGCDSQGTGGVGEPAAGGYKCGGAPGSKKSVACGLAGLFTRGSITDFHKHAESMGFFFFFFFFEVGGKLPSIIRKINMHSALPKRGDFTDFSQPAFYIYMYSRMSNFT